MDYTVYGTQDLTSSLGSGDWRTFAAVFAAEKPAAFSAGG